MGILMDDIIVRGTVFFIILYFVTRVAVEDGTINALKKYDNMKNHQNKNENEDS
ncbi:hypothetical protein [Clostridium lundense]|uniref:hypothetical protein n=1 Tax=Clostridium lundense TaxID=319475 RepID=UPI000AB8757D|nr:hypothetical protein [Clostridium lundense]